MVDKKTAIKQINELLSLLIAKGYRPTQAYLFGWICRRVNGLRGLGGCFLERCEWNRLRTRSKTPERRRASVFRYGRGSDVSGLEEAVKAVRGYL